MLMMFEVAIDTDDATAQEMEDALKHTLQSIELEDGDTLEPVSVEVTYKRPPGLPHSCDIPGCAVCDPCYGL